MPWIIHLDYLNISIDYPFLYIIEILKGKAQIPSYKYDQATGRPHKKSPKDNIY